MAKKWAILLACLMTVHATIDEETCTPGTECTDEAASSMIQVRTAGEIQRVDEGDQTEDSQCKVLYSTWNDNGRVSQFVMPHGQLYFLDRHAVFCESLPGYGMSGFRMEANINSNQVRFRVVCCPVPAVANNTVYETSKSGQYDKAMVRSLEQTTAVDCGQGKLLQNWRVTDTGDVKYKCLEIPQQQKQAPTLTCSAKKTEPQLSLGLNFLDRHSVYCPDGELMQSWDLKFKGTMKKPEDSIPKFGDLITQIKDLAKKLGLTTVKSAYELYQFEYTCCSVSP